jgi:REP element-mobilizing transposase RayT
MIFWRKCHYCRKIFWMPNAREKVFVHERQEHLEKIVLELFCSAIGFTLPAAVMLKELEKQNSKHP